MFFQRGAKVGGDGQVARFTVELQLDLDGVSRIHVRGLAQGGVDLYAIASAACGSRVTHALLPTRRGKRGAAD